MTVKQEQYASAKRALEIIRGKRRRYDRISIAAGVSGLTLAAGCFVYSAIRTTIAASEEIGGPIGAMISKGYEGSVYTDAEMVATNLAAALGIAGMIAAGLYALRRPNLNGKIKPIANSSELEDIARGQAVIINGVRPTDVATGMIQNAMYHTTVVGNYQGERITFGATDNELRRRIDEAQFPNGTDVCIIATKGRDSLTLNYLCDAIQ